jgi:hypothetical protein
MPRVTDEDLRRWRDDGWVVLAGYLDDEALADATAAVARTWPDPGRLGGDPEAGIVEFPFAEVALSLLAVHDDVVALARAALGTASVRLYHAEAWAKRAGAADYAQRLHRDFVNHTLTVPSDDPRYGQLLLYVYLTDVGEGDGATRFVDRSMTASRPLLPPALDPAEHGPVYAAERAATGPAGTVVAYRPDSFHRGAALTAPDAWRVILLTSYRPAEAEWMQRYGWADRGYWPGWRPFVEAASPDQLALVGFPPPGHPFWTPATLHAVATRYPGLDLEPWRQRS